MMDEKEKFFINEVEQAAKDGAMHRALRTFHDFVPAMNMRFRVHTEYAFRALAQNRLREGND